MLFEVREHFRNELQAHVADDQVDYGIALVFAMMTEGEPVLSKFVKMRINVSRSLLKLEAFGARTA